MQKEIPLPSTAAGGPPNAITELCVEEKATKCPNVEAAESQIEMTESTASINEEKAKNELAKRLHADATDPSNDYPVTVRLIGHEMARGIVDEAILTVTPEQMQEAISEAIPRAISRAVLKFINVLPKKVQEEVFQALDEDVSGPFTKAEVAELVGGFAKEVLPSEGQGIVAAFVGQLAEHLVLEVGGHVTQENAQQMVREAIRKNFGKEVREARTRVALIVTAKVISELMNRGATQRQVEVAATVAVKEAMTLIIQGAEEVISEVVVSLVDDLNKTAAQKLPGLAVQDYQEILRVDCRRQGKSFKTDYASRVRRLSERSSEPEQNVMEERNSIQRYFERMRVSFSESYPTFEKIALPVMILSIFSNAIHSLAGRN